MKLAVMSDLHIGLAARSKDLCPVPPSTSRKDLSKYNAKTDDSYRSSFVGFITREGIAADYLVLPGDITNKAKPQEVQIASEFVKQVAEALSVPYDKIIFAPGNHDVDWSVHDPADSTGVRWGQRYETIGHSNFHFRNIIELGHGDIFIPPHFISWSFDDLFAVAYNSASHDRPDEEHHIHHGLADPRHLDPLRAHLETIPRSDVVRLFLVHHHSVDFANPILRIPDYSLMTNAENLLNLLHEFNFDILIHGHKHHPRFDTHSTATYPHLPILCAGSFSVEIDTQWAGTIDNQFHLVTIDGRVGTDNGIIGKITSWSNNHSRGWIPSEELTTGIHHIIPFGSYVMPAELDARLEPFIQEWLEGHDHILWQHIVYNFPELEHLPLGSALLAFKRIAARLGRKTMHETLKDLILY